jgi:hypothetical protein
MLLRTAASVLGTGLLLAGSGAWAQPPAQLPPVLSAPPVAATPGGHTLTYIKPAYQPTVPALQRTALQPVRPGDRAPADDAQSGYQIQLEPPGSIRLFGQLDSETALQKRWREQARERRPPENIAFPEEPVVSTQAYAGRAWPGMRCVAEPAYVCYGRLYFEQLNAERYGWDFGILHPIISAGVFYADLATWPYRWATDPFRCYDCNTGYCLPGSPVPLRLYPLGASLTGTIAEAGVVVALLAIFP